LLAWQEFTKGKRGKKDVQEFSLRLMDNIFSLHEELKKEIYTHGFYKYFRINDPKPRDIHKASVRDRLVHHAIYRVLYPYFSKRFIHDSYSCQLGKGTHKALNRFRAFARKVSKNNTRTCWVLKCDIRKFFANIDHEILIEILQRQIADPDTLGLLKNVVGSFRTANQKSLPASPYLPVRQAGSLYERENKGLPLGNLTSQLLVNIYMNEFDQWVKHKLKEKYYIRYADDFAFLSENRAVLENLIPRIQEFFGDRLRLELHPNKLFIKTVASGVDFLGWVHFPDHRVLRTATKRRMLRKLAEQPKKEAMISSYLGLLSHGNTRKLRRVIGY